MTGVCFMQKINLNHIRLAEFSECVNHFSEYQSRLQVSIYFHGSFKQSKTAYICSNNGSFNSFEACHFNLPFSCEKHDQKSN